ncbi:MAG: amidohydrolase family protein [Deltaproteobacteria bacterium]|jgi:N-acyl-D-aspartate/D-glutamate deacylase|nr:amidohydrolase family protein [Deltaproteobacteria bacterium]
MLDILIRGGDVIDGTGAPARRADVGIRDGKIIAIGEIREEARETLDATGKVVCPGFVDVNTHYDAQVFWDGTVSPSCFHGVTTILAGNCGFSIAPLSKEAGAYLMPMLARVEGMPLESLEQGVPWDWSSFGEYLSRLDGGLGVNAGFMVGHSAVRRVVMGDRAVGHEATSDELEKMKQLMSDSLAEGGMGFSTTIAVTHNDADGRPVPSRHASREELVELARVCAEHEGTTVEFLPGLGKFDADMMQLMTDISLAANRPVNWNALAGDSQDREMMENRLAATDYARERGGEVVALTVPQPATLRLNLHSGFVFDALGGWAELFEMPIEERMIKLKDPDYRKVLDEGARSEASGMLRTYAQWDEMIVADVFDPAHESLKGRTLGEIGREQGKSAFDAMLDLALSEELRTLFFPVPIGGDRESWDVRGELWRDDRTIIGASDAGAHLDMIDTFAQTTQVLGNGVRRYGLIELEEAVRQLSDVPAQLLGLRDRGRLVEGWRADVVIFDADRVDTGPVHARTDLPGGALRLYADALGIEHVIVNGVQTIRDGEHTGALPGTVLRSGRDTRSVTVPRAEFTAR